MAPIARLGEVRRPVRTCIGCRQKADKSDLLRLVVRVTVVADLQQRQPGRGAYLHPRGSCLDAAIRRRALGRALRVNGVDQAALAEAVAPHLDPAAAEAVWSAHAPPRA